MRYSYYILILLFGILSGVSIAIFRITHWQGDDATIVNGSWRGHHLMDVGKDPLLTARIATVALYALNPDEAIYLFADEDDKGRPLSSNHDYVIRGVPVDTRYWSITLYGDDYFLVPNDIRRFSYNMNNLHYENDSSYTIHISSSQKEGNWIPCGKSGKFHLAMRLYNPAPHVYNDIKKTHLPVIEREE